MYILKNDIKKLIPEILINYEALAKQFNTLEFGQILYELRIKISAGFQNLRSLTEANQKLRKTIKGELKQ